MASIFLHGGGDDPHSRHTTFGRFATALGKHRSAPLALVIAEATEADQQANLEAYGAVFAELGIEVDHIAPVLTKTRCFRSIPLACRFGEADTPITCSARRKMMCVCRCTRARRSGQEMLHGAYTAPPQKEACMLVELMRYRITPNKSARVDEWMHMLNERKADAIETLGRSRIYVETICRDRRADADWLPSFFVGEEDGEPLHTSPYPLDHDHLALFEECLDRDYEQDDLVPQMVLFAPTIAQAMHEAPR